MSEDSNPVIKTPPCTSRSVIIRKRSDPHKSGPNILYKCVRSSTFTIRGRRIHFQFYQGDLPLFHTKLKSKRPTDPIPIQKGTEMHYSSNDFVGFMLSTNDHLDFSLRSQTEYGKEILSIHMTYPNIAMNTPKDIRVNFFIKDSFMPHDLISKKPTMNDDGEWILDFHGKPLITSVKNSIFISETENIEYVITRKTDTDTVEIDAVDLISPLSVFGIALSLFISA